MHRRYYILIAKVLRRCKNYAKTDVDIDGNEDTGTITVNKVISEFCQDLKAEVSSFNKTKFRDYIEKGE